MMITLGDTCFAAMSCLHRPNSENSTAQPSHPSSHFMQFCMFHAGLPDILPVGDLGVRRGLAKLYDLTELPDAVAMEMLTQHWRPYRTVGSYFMWRVEVPHGAYSPSKGKRKAVKAAP
jgi:hypothetical protein